MADLIKIEIVKPEIPTEWNYDKSVEIVKSSIYKAKNLTEDILKELYIAREILSKPGYRTDLVANATRLPIWDDYCQDIGVDRTTVHRWINKYLNPAHVSHSTGYSEWNTPPKFIEAAKQLMGSIDIDPASNEKAQEIIKAEKYYTQENNGLDKEWKGNVWMNPPYSQPLIKEFCFKLIEKIESKEINQACVLINNATETEFVQEMLKICKAVCFIKGRVKFIDMEGKESGSPLQGQFIIYFGNESAKFKKVFSQFGEILWKEEK